MPNQSVDRISTLPDEVLCHILSFLPTEHAVAASVLSKRWRDLWRSVPSLSFDHTRPRKRETRFRFEHSYCEKRESCFRFNEFVYSVLLMRDPMQPIQRFHLVLDDKTRDLSNAYKWVQFVVKHRVEHLHLEMFFMNNMLNLPGCVLSCKTLVVLKLSRFHVKDVSSVILPSLKILHLDHTTFPRSRILIEILSGCPILEDFKVECVLLETRAVFLTLGEIESLSLPKLIRADIVDSYIDLPLKALSNVEFLRIDLDQEDPLYNHIPAFHNLTHLDLIFLEYDYHLFVQVLEHCPKLEVLVLTKHDWATTKYDNKSWVDPEHVPECISLHLRTCTFQKFEGLEGVLLLARYILKNARVLQTMTICPGDTQIIEELSLCPTSSATCQILGK